ncbi:hypothetical protein M409DRAFT_59446 [Zasmidium cellare ATCC 36951]|uniref:Zn(2)-C6 fungal-type domain-containing protein n=1 Tax=Zasmidium cellare ATCC 36951 TaxID=1080233 RepID=A0A6A6C1H5_ZASCE|nr:uncharacterized protein M409DRAFT_59446 [Zasmidium cellare ATCC 36951]KAF2160917.1 hypothetical protein M409DRAFT_59446 [Zasmidium cellare ATCC 36951]
MLCIQRDPDQYLQCDQDWPKCWQCESSNRECPGPPRKVKFMPVRTRPPKKNKTDDAVSLAPKLDDTTQFATCPDQLTAEYIHTSSIRSTGLACLDKQETAIRAAINPCLSWSVATQLATLLDDNIECLPFFASCSYIEEVPRMLDSSPALTATIACCLDACQQTYSVPRRKRALDASLYGQALATINDALEHSSASLSTFLAVSLIARLESLLCPRQLARIPCWSIHASGISDLLRSRGVFDHNDRVAQLAVLENFGPIIADSILKDQDCFLSLPEWQQPLCLHSNIDKHDPHCLTLEVFSQLAFLPSLIAAVRRYRRSEGSAIEACEAAKLAMFMHSSLETLDRAIGGAYISRLSVGPPTWVDIDAPIWKVYQEPSQQDSRTITWHALLTIILNKALIFLKSSVDFYIEGLGNHLVEDLEAQAHRCSVRIWMLAEVARQKGVAEFYFYPEALCSTYEYTNNDNERDWIVSLMNEVISDTWLVETWTRQAVKNVSLTLAGVFD